MEYSLPTLTYGALRLSCSSESIGIVSLAMENAKPHRKASFIIRWGVVWGGLMTLLIEVMDWYPNRHLDPLSHILVRLGINIALGFVPGAFMWNRLEAQRRAKLTQSQGAVRFALFVVLMLGLAYLLWWMVGRKP